MRKLLKADFYSIIKNKITLIGFILCIGFPILLGIIGLFVNNAFDSSFEILSFDMMFTSSFSPSNNLGIFIPLTAGTFVIHDFQDGTLRNKIISGNSRTKICISHFISSLTLCFALIFVYALSSFAINCLCFDTEYIFTADTLKEIAKLTVLGITTFIFLASVSTCLAFIFKSLPGTIIFTILICVGLFLGTTIISIFENNDNSLAFSFIPMYSLSKMISSLLVSTDTYLFVNGIIVNVLLTFVFGLLGTLSFLKTDIK